MKQALSILSLSAALMISGLLFTPALVFAEGSCSGSCGVNSVPEPASLMLVGAGLAGIVIARRKFK